MEFLRKLKTLKESGTSKDNIIITVMTGDYTNSKAIVSQGEITYTNNEKYNWKSIISIIPKNKKSQLVEMNGEKIYIEFMKNKYSVVVCGAGHISISIIKMCNLLDLPVTVIDDRITFVNNAINAGADFTVCEPFEKALDTINGDSSTFFIIVTRGHRYDQECLKKIINKDNAYIGMIGSKVRVGKVLNGLEEEGISRDKLNKVYTPIGLDIGAETPAEIAVAIMAQIIDVKNKETGSSTYSDELLDGIMDESVKKIPKALVTIVSRKGSAPREVGTKMAVLKDGTMIGTIGGGCVEAGIRQVAFSSMDQGVSKLVQVDMTGREAEDEGMVCGGIVEIFVEPLI
jgi:xanthine dehydrogenase accessory factor